MAHPAANPDASAEARELLAYLYTIQGTTTLSAQHNYLSAGVRYFDEIEKVTGRRPRIFGGDFSFCYRGDHPERLRHCGPANMDEPGAGVTDWNSVRMNGFNLEGAANVQEIDLDAAREALVRRCLELHSQGHLITLMWHCPTPDCGDVSGDADIWTNQFPDERFQEILTPGSELNVAWEGQVDRIAQYLTLLRDAQVPVLWRPYHEMNGAWFWWGNRRDPEAGFISLWRMLYQRFTQVHELHNLLWVCNPNAPRDTPGDEAYAYDLFYPGHDCVDVLATDVYHNDYRESHYTDLLKLGDGRPVALGEVGHLPTPELLQAQPKWSWVMPWGALVFCYNSAGEIKRLYEVLD